MSRGATERLSRLLTMVPWLLRHQGVPVTEAARHFGLSDEQLVRDLELLFVCGLPGHLPGDLIEADWETGRIYLDNADTIAEPLRLAADEAVALIAGLRTLADLPGTHDRAAVDSALAKLSDAASDALPIAARLTVDLTAGVEEAVLAAARDGLARRRRLRLRYLVPARDEITERDVDPMRLRTVAGRWYLEAWCHRADGVRTFRVDRIAGLEVLDADGTPPAGARPRDGDDAVELFTPADDDVLVTLDVEPRARGVAEYYPTESTEELGDGRLRVRLRVADPRWIPRLVLRLGGAGRVVEPAALADAAAAQARAALSAYS